jgi:hypothetical protein
MPAPLEVNGTPVKVLPGSYREEDQYVAAPVRTAGGQVVSPVTGARNYRRIATFDTPWDARATTLATRELLESMDAAWGGYLPQANYRANPQSVRLVNHPELPAYARLSCTFWVDLMEAES